MPTGNQHGGRRGGILAAAAVAAVLAIMGGLVLFVGMRGTSGPSEPPLERRVASSTAGPGSRATSPPSVTSPANKPAGSPHPPVDLSPVLSASDPVGLDIPSIGVHSKDLVGLGLAKDGSIEVPTDFGQPGWYTLGPTPGEFGPAVISGHVDSKKGPAIFYRLGAVKVGEQVKVSRKDGSSATFVIDKVGRYAKTDFPTSLVYGTTKRAEIRLVTCGGTFDQATGHYVDNIVVFGHLLA